MGDNNNYYNYDSQKNFDEGATNGASATGDGYGGTGEAYTDTNAVGTDQTPQDYGETGEAGEAGDMNYYDQDQYERYYYQDDDGNYFYYTDPQTEMANETEDNAGVAPTAQNLIRSYEYEDWEPRRYNWFVDIILETFFSKMFRLYLTAVLYSGGAFMAVMGLNYSFQILYRVYHPPNQATNTDLQAFSYLSMFFYLSFVIVSAFCTLIDMMRNLWWLKREDKVFWGFSHRYFSKQKPPYIVYLVIILVTVFLPLIWGIVDAAVSKQSLIYVAERYANVVVLVGAFLIIICYVWFYWRAIVYKRSAVNTAKDRDDYRQREKAFKHHPEKMNKRHWYHAQIILEEFGVDGKTLRYNSIVFTVGLVPLFALYAAQLLTTVTGDPSPIWGAISSIAFACVYIIAWMSLLHWKGQWAVYVSFTLNLVFLVIGVVGAGLSGDPSLVGVVLVLFVAAQGLHTRKRKHSLTRKELCDTLKIPLNREIEKSKKKRQFDTYLFCCRDVILNYFRCCDVKTHFGYRHPDVVKAERRYAIRRLALRTDQKALVVWWVVVMFAAAFVIALGNGVSYKYTSTIAVSGLMLPNGTHPNNSLCKATYNEGGSAPLQMLDLAFLSALSYSYGTDGDKDFATWFSQSPTLQRLYPEHLPPTLNYATDGIEVRFSDYVDTSSDFHFITLNSNSRGIAVFRNVDFWSESMALTVAGAISPLVSIWGPQNRAAFVQDGAFLKNWFPPSTALDGVKVYIEALIEAGLRDRILLVGDQFNGGYAKLLSSEYGVRFTVFNPPGVRYKVPFLPNGTQVSAVRNLWSYVDSLEDTAETIYVPCDDEMSANLCGRISTTIDYLLETCGDAQGRSIQGV